MITRSHLIPDAGSWAPLQTGDNDITISLSGGSTVTSWDFDLSFCEIFPSL